MNGWALACLATMAVALLAMAIAQMVLAWQAVQIARQALATTQDVRRDFQPLLAKAHKIADDASKVTAMALVQAERIDQAVATTVQRIDETSAIIQTAIIEPVRQSAAIIAGLRAAFSAFSRPRPAHEDEESLFVG